MSIDIGNDAIDREYTINNSVFNVLFVDVCSPATKNGTVTKLRIFIDGGLGGTLRIGNLYKTNSTTFSSRDWGIVAIPTIGLNEYTQWQYLGVGGDQAIQMAVQTGDFIGVRMFAAATGKGVAADVITGAGYWRSLAESDFPYTDYELNNVANVVISLNGEMPVTFIPKVFII